MEGPVIHRMKHDKPDGRDLAAEPEMMELKRMIRAGELKPARLKKHLKGAKHEEQGK